MTTRAPDSLTIYSTCPQSKDVPQAEYLRTAVRHAQWSEEAGCAGMLLYTDNGLVDPWHLAHAVMAHTDRLAPLVAVQPIYMHPYWVAKQIASLAFLHGRKVALNMLAGGFRNDLLALGDDTPHDDRYVRTAEYTRIITGLLEGRAPVTLDGRYYRVTNLTLAPALPESLFPDILISGSSDAGLEAARTIGATAIRYPKPAEQEVGEADLAGVACGVRVGIIARDTADRAWRVAAERFPATRQGAVLHRLATAVSDSVWHRQLSDLEERPAGPDSPYWLGPFRNYKTFCPYLVGTYEDVATELARYIAKGHRTVILDISPSAAEFEHINTAFDLALNKVSHAQAAA
ncbi:LLM class flavin-dependent oxidoreductase [Azospirillum halopraeferens]|uniref:LLM class flavin-dependent oxidoreductase n=1 Tax=Azospirillum halopraeferens TaxID=34010 RepID=UPI0006844FAE|nr:LLM class flavin-dependent oxidoreductase [Azospirillum halopraeferens]